MNVLNVYRTYYPDPTGGMQEAIRQLSLASGNFGVKNTIFTLSPNPEPSKIIRPEAVVERARSWLAPASCDIGGPSAFRLYRKVSASSDIIHFFFPWPFADVLQVCTRPRAPYVVTYVSDIVRQRTLKRIYSPLMWRMLEGARFVVANSQNYVDTSPVLSHPSIRKKVRVIPLGIVESSYAVEGDNEIFTRIGLQTDEPYFLFVGVLRYYKGAHVLVRAAKSIKARVVIAGSGPEESSLKKLADDVGANNVIFAGQITEKEKVALVRNCRALVLPSHLRSEAFGMVLVEGAMYGRPLISCEIGTGTSFVNAHGESGLVVAPEDHLALVHAMRSLLEDEKLAEALGHGARRRYERLFSGDAMGKAYSDLYVDTLN